MRLDLSNTKVFFQELKRCCITRISCDDCFMNPSNKSKGCADYLLYHPQEAIESLQEWSDNNPPKIDWLKVPVNTPVMIRNYNNDKTIPWERRYFAVYLPNVECKFLCFGSELPQKRTKNVEYWRYCKLADEVDPTPYLKED